MRRKEAENLHVVVCQSEDFSPSLLFPILEYGSYWFASPQVEAVTQIDCEMQNISA
jgi:hypothetical protein